VPLTAAPEIVHKRTDRLGYRLRGEPEPIRPEQPELAYRWVKDSALNTGATVTVVTGVTVEEVLRSFGADPARPESLRFLDEDATARMSIYP
jgi:phage tail tape-measure protein